jgi:GDPmannose 4,6-dehydratase
MKALITGITGQSGSYLAELLLDQNIEVFGLVRRSSIGNTQRIDHLRGKIVIAFGDMCDPVSLNHAVGYVKPDWVFNFAAQSFVGESWRQPKYTFDVVAGGTLNLLEAVRNYAPNAKFIQASSSEMFGASPPPQNELTPFYPRSPYGIAKLAAHWSCVNYRESYGMPISCAIFFNMESARRGIEFVTRKVSHGVAMIANGKATELRLGNLDAKRDWSHARDHVRAAFRMILADKPDDYVIGSGTAYSVRNFVERAFTHANLNWQDYVVIDPALVRPAEVNYLLANATKAKGTLGWRTMGDLQELVEEMVDNDMQLVKEGGV